MNKTQIRIILRLNTNPFNLSRPSSWSVNGITTIEEYIERYNKTYITQLRSTYQQLKNNLKQLKDEQA